MDKPLPTKILGYADAARWISDRIDYERVCPQRAAANFCLERIESLLALFGSPQQRIPVIHIAGTKGKGSTAAILDSILRSCGINCGLFTSPHIHQFAERMRVAGQTPTNAELTALVSELRTTLSNSSLQLTEHDLTYFEVATLLAWMYFDQKQAELVVLETGLGGRLDCTNVCQPLLTIITNIGLDHTRILGDTVDLIAAEKAGIIKPGIPVLTWTTQPEALAVISDRAAELGCQLFHGGSDIAVTVDAADGDGSQRLTVGITGRPSQQVELSLAGLHQSRNAALAVAAADLLSAHDNRITPTGIATGTATVVWPLRFEVFAGHPLIVLDGAHNPDAAAALVETLRSQFRSRRRQVLIFGSSRDKDSRRMLEQLCPEFDAVVLTEYQTNPRAVKCRQLRDDVQGLALSGEPSAVDGGIHEAANPAAALQLARQIAGANGLICGTGSIFLAAEVAVDSE